MVYLSDLKMKFKDKLIKMQACKDAIKWVGTKTLKEAWQTCPRGDWMLQEKRTKRKQQTYAEKF